MKSEMDRKEMDLTSKKWNGKPTLASMIHHVFHPLSKTPMDSTSREMTDGQTSIRSGMHLCRSRELGA